MKHAPGEWRIEKRMDCIAIVDNDGKEIVFLFNKGSVTTQLRTKDELEANARLIAAAPKLLEALKRIKNICLSVEYEVEIDDEAIIDICCENINLAEGK